MTSGNKAAKIHRDTAQKLLDGFMDRVREVNSSYRFCYTVTDVVVFGSFVNSDKDMLSDLDIAINMECRYDMHSEQIEAKRNEYKGTDFLQRLVWPYEEVLRFLRNRSHYISIHRLGRDDEEDAIIFSDKVMRMEVPK